MSHHFDGSRFELTVHSFSEPGQVLARATVKDDAQKIIGEPSAWVLELPGDNSALVSVQRSSQLILHDLETGMKKGAIDLAGRAGNPRLQLRNAGKEVCASDYDTLVVVQRKDWRILRSARLQAAGVDSQQFIGDYSFAPDEAGSVSKDTALRRPQEVGMTRFVASAFVITVRWGTATATSQQ